MSRYRQQLEDKHMSHLNVAFDVALECLLIVFPVKKLSNLLDAEVALMMQNSLEILPVILPKHLRPDFLDMDFLFPAAPGVLVSCPQCRLCMVLQQLVLSQNLSQNWSSGGKTCVPQIKTWWGGSGWRKRKRRYIHQRRWRRLAMTAGSGGFDYSWLEDLPPRSGFSSSISFALSIINPKIASRELSSPANLTGAQALCIPDPLEVIMIG